MDNSFRGETTISSPGLPVLHTDFESLCETFSIADDDLRKHAQFASLLKDLSRHITPHGHSRTKQKKILKAQRRLNEEKQRYFCHRILHDETVNLVRDYQGQQGLAGDDAASTAILASDPEIWQGLHHLLIVEHAMLHLDLVPVADAMKKRANGATEMTTTTTTTSTEATRATTNSVKFAGHLGDDDEDVVAGNEANANLLGLERRDLDVSQKDPARYHELQRRIKQSIEPELQLRLRATLDKVAEFYFVASPDSSSYGEEEITNVHDIVSKEIANNDRGRTALSSMRRATNTAFWEFYKVSCKRLELLHRILEKYKLSSQYKYDQALTSSLQLRARTMILKLRVLKYQFLRETYMPETVEALKTIKYHLDVAKREALATHDGAIHRLEEYKATGLGFDKLVEEYTQILQEIDQQKWALARLNKTKT